MSDEFEEELAALEEEAATEQRDKVKPIIDPTRMKQDLKITVDLSQSFGDQAGLFASYAHKAHQASFQADKFKQKMEITEARVDKRLRDEAVESGTKVTEAALTKQIRLDEEYQKAAHRYNEAKMVAGLTKEAAEAFKQRRDMLIQMGADAREEFKGSMRMSGKKEELNEKAKAALKANSQ